MGKVGRLVRWPWITCIMSHFTQPGHNLSTYLVLYICSKYSSFLQHVLMHTTHGQSTQQSNVHTTLQHHAPVTRASEATCIIVNAMCLLWVHIMPWVHVHACSYSSCSTMPWVHVHACSYSSCSIMPWVHVHACSYSSCSIEEIRNTAERTLC